MKSNDKESVIQLLEKEINNLTEQYSRLTKQNGNTNEREYIKEKLQANTTWLNDIKQK